MCVYTQKTMEYYIFFIYDIFYLYLFVDGQLVLIADRQLFSHFPCSTLNELILLFENATLSKSGCDLTTFSVIELHLSH